MQRQSCQRQLPTGFASWMSCAEGKQWHFADLLVSDPRVLRSCRSVKLRPQSPHEQCGAATATALRAKAVSCGTLHHTAQITRQTGPISPVPCRVGYLVRRECTSTAGNNARAKTAAASMNLALFEQHCCLHIRPSRRCATRERLSRSRATPDRQQTLEQSRA